MQIKCYRQLDYHMMDLHLFILFKSERKWTVGVLPNGDEWLLPSGLTLKEVEQLAPALMRISRSVLVTRDHILGVSGSCKARELHTSVGAYRLSRALRAQPFELIAQQNQARVRLEHYLSLS